MNETFKPWIVIAVAVIVNLLAVSLKIYGLHPFLRPLFWLIVCFAFGMSLNDSKKKSSAWVLKLIIAGILLVLFLYDIRLLKINMLDRFFNQLYIEAFFLRLIYIWCGWAFFRK